MDLVPAPFGFASFLQFAGMSFSFFPCLVLCCNLVMYARFIDLLLLCIWDLSFSSGSCACSFSSRFATGCIFALVLCVISMWDIWFEGCVWFMLPCSCLIPWFVFIAFWSFDSCMPSPSPPPGISLAFCGFHVWPMMGLWNVLCDIKLNSFFSGQDVLPPCHFLLFVMSLLISLSEVLYCLVHAVHLIWILFTNPNTLSTKRKRRTSLSSDLWHRTTFDVRLL